jgi:hypothetical protein
MKTPKMKTIATVLLVAMASLFTGTLLASVATSGPNPITHNYDLALAVSSAGVCAVSLAGRYAKLPQVSVPGLRVADVQREIWIDAVVSKLFADNAILGRVSRDDAYVLGGKVVHLPQAGANLGGEVNRTVFPAGVVQRTDTDVTYPLNVYTTNPALLQNAEQAELSYDKMVDLMTDQIEWLDGALTADLLYAWTGVGAAQQLRTSGSDSALNLAPSATGTRKTLTAADFKRAMVVLNKANVSKVDRIALLDSDMLGELLDDPLLTSRDVTKEADYKEGRVARLYGFDIMERSELPVYTNAAPPVKKAVGAAGAAADNKSSLFFQKNALAMAMGDKDFFENKQDPTYYGDIYSMLLRAGGRQRRSDGKGVVSIIQAHGA